MRPQAGQEVADSGGAGRGGRAGGQQAHAGRGAPHPRHHCARSRRLPDRHLPALPQGRRPRPGRYCTVPREAGRSSRTHPRLAQPFRCPPASPSVSSPSLIPRQPPAGRSARTPWEASHSRLSSAAPAPRGWARPPAPAWRPLEHKLSIKPPWGFQSTGGGGGVLLFGSFLVLSSVWETGWEGSTRKAHTCPSQARQARRAHPFLQHMCTTCKVCPSRKEEPPPLSMGEARGMEHLSLKRESKLKKI